MTTNGFKIGGRRAFTMVEMVLALAITAFVVVLLLGLVVEGVNSAADSKADSLMVFMADQVRAKLLSDLDWPEGTSAKALKEDTSFKTDVYFDREGVEAKATEDQFYKGTMIFSRSPNYSSARLDYINLEFRRVTNDRVLSTFTMQRARQKPRPES